jgi:hypothetical protein
MKHIFSAHHSDKHQILKFILITTSCLLFIIIFFEFILINYWQFKDYIYQDNKVSTENKTIRADSNALTKPLNPSVYESQVRSILSSLNPEQINESTCTRVRENLVALSVPKEYLDFHLNLVIKIDALSSAFKEAALNPSREHDLALTGYSETLQVYLVSTKWLAK